MYVLAMFRMLSFFWLQLIFLIMILVTGERTGNQDLLSSILQLNKAASQKSIIERPTTQENSLADNISDDKFWKGSVNSFARLVC